ncbi:hypothetical protein CJ750_24875 [Salmonella enterica subsp. enterica]|nr:hypothetical protein [Salmonella enterica subsp. enterica]EBH8640732.1 hypothetical protein [Salmonella enterica subsp. enterica serovar Thompson]
MINAILIKINMFIIFNNCYFCFLFLPDIGVLFWFFVFAWFVILFLCFCLVFYFCVGLLGYLLFFRFLRNIYLNSFMEI